MGRELSILRKEDRQAWGDIPGDRNRDLRHQFQIFTVMNPKEVLYGQVPNSMMIGPWTFDEERDSENIIVSEETDFTGYTGEMFNYIDYINFFKTGSPANGTALNTTFPVYNYETFAMQYSHRAEEKFMRASKSLSAMINYTSIQIRDKLVLHQLREDYYEKYYSTQEKFTTNRLFILQQNGVSEATVNSMWKDKVFGFSIFDNFAYWGSICEDREPLREQFIHDYFYISFQVLEEFLKQI